MASRDFGSLEKAKNYAFLLLKFRLRSEHEIASRLKRKKFEDKVIKETIDFLRDRDFLNDNLFAKSWIESRLKKPLGLRRIKEELRIKGINAEIIDSQIQELKDLYPEEEIVVNLARQRLARLRNIEPLKAKRRVFAFLLRRGFSPDVITEAINKI